MVSWVMAIHIKKIDVMPFKLAVYCEIEDWCQSKFV